jgi:hypothetical protein
MSVKLRQELERRIVTQVIDSALAAGYQLSVDDGEEITVKRSVNKEEILAAMFTTDEDRLHFSRPGDTNLNELSGWVYFVYGNDGYDVVNDYTTNLEEVMKLANELADKYAD